MLISSLWKKTNCSASATPRQTANRPRAAKPGLRNLQNSPSKIRFVLIEANFRIKGNADKQQLMPLPAWILMKTHECVSLLTSV